MFRALLNSSEKRQLKLVEQLSDEKGHTMEELSNLLGYSIRTIRNDIDYFREEFDDLFSIQLSKTNHWFIKRKKSLSILHAMNRIYRDNLNVQLLKLMLEKKHMSLEEYAQDLHTSYSSLFRNIKMLNELLERFHLSVSTKPFQLKGEMQQIRYFYSLLFWSVLHSFSGDLYERYTPKVEAFVGKLIEDPSFEMTIVEEEKVFYYTMVTLIFIEKGEIDTHFVSPIHIPNVLYEKLVCLEEELPFEVPESEKELLAFSILPFYKKKKDVLAPSQILTQNKLYQSFCQYIDELIETTGVQMTNKETFLMNITLKSIQVSYYKGGIFLQEPLLKRNMIDSLGWQFRSFVRQARTLLKDYPLIRNSITMNDYSFVYWLITNWEGFFEEIYRLSPTFRMMIVSEMGSAQENFLWDVIHYEFPFFFSFYPYHTYRKTHVPPDILITDTYSLQVLAIGHETPHVLNVNYHRIESIVEELSEILTIIDR